jgi:hypothetical protein
LLKQILLYQPGVRLDSLKTDQWLVDDRTADGRGYALRTTGNGGVETILNDGRTENRWASDPRSLVAGKAQHIAAIVDGGPKIITFVIDGRFNDGSDARQFGWGRFSPNLKSAAGAPEMQIGRNLDGKVLSLRVYDRYLRTSEAIAAFHAGM